jgi:hypothetical protein
MFHPLITTFKKSFTGFVPVNNRACPAAKPGIAASGRAGINLNGTFTTPSL